MSEAVQNLPTELFWYAQMSKLSLNIDLKRNKYIKMSRDV